MRSSGRLQERSSGIIGGVYGRARGNDALRTDAARSADLTGVATRGNPQAVPEEAEALMGKPSASSHRNPNARGDTPPPPEPAQPKTNFWGTETPYPPLMTVTVAARTPTHLPTAGAERSTICTSTKSTPEAGVMHTEEKAE